MLCYYVDTTHDKFMAKYTSSDKFVIHHNLQVELAQICNPYGIPPPSYTLQEKRIIAGYEYMRFYGSLVSGSVGKPSVSIGRYAKTEFDAKEDVAAILIHRLLALSGHTIRDFNYYNVELLQEELETTKKENLELKFELGIQNEKKKKNEFNQ